MTITSYIVLNLAKPDLLVVSYIPYGSSNWTVLEESKLPGMAMINQNNGHINNSDCLSVWNDIVNKMDASGVPMIGYVDTCENRGCPGHTLRTIEQITTNIDAYYHCYPKISGIFFDDYEANAGNYSRNKEIYNYVKNTFGQNQVIIINPGDVPNDPTYSIGVCDIIVSFEGYANTYNNSWNPKWTINATDYGLKTANLIHDVSNGSLLLPLLSKAQTNKADYVYITDTYEYLPSYWNEELHDIKL